MSQCCSFRGLFWGLATLGVVADQVSKYRVFGWLYPMDRTTDDGLTVKVFEREFDILRGVFKLHTSFTGETETGTGLRSALRTWGGDFLPQVNQGALFGLFQNHREIANAGFAVISILAAVAILYWATRGATKRDSILTVALGLILAGTLGNLYDRIVFGGVRDFLYFYYINWPVFNVADCCLVCGACLLLVQAFWVRSCAEQPALHESVKQGEPAKV